MKELPANSIDIIYSLNVLAHLNELRTFDFISQFSFLPNIAILYAYQNIVTSIGIKLVIYGIFILVMRQTCRITVFKFYWFHFPDLICSRFAPSIHRNTRDLRQVVLKILFTGQLPP